MKLARTKGGVWVPQSPAIITRRGFIAGAAAVAAYGALGPAEAFPGLPAMLKPKPAAAGNPWALVDFDAAQGASGGTTKAFNTTAVNLILIWETSTASGNTPSDSVNGGWSGSWVVLPDINNSYVTGNLSAVIPGVTAGFSTGAAQTFSCGGASASAISVATFTTTGLLSGIAVDQFATNVSATASPVAAGPITPGFSNELILMLLGTNGIPSAWAINSGMTVLGTTDGSAEAIGGAMAWKFQTTPAAITPQYTFSSGSTTLAIGEVCSIKS